MFEPIITPETPNKTSHQALTEINSRLERLENRLKDQENQIGSRLTYLEKTVKGSSLHEKLKNKAQQARSSLRGRFVGAARKVHQLWKDITSKEEPKTPFKTSTASNSFSTSGIPGTLPEGFTPYRFKTDDFVDKRYSSTNR